MINLTKLAKFIFNLLQIFAVGLWDYETFFGKVPKFKSLMP